MFQLNGTPLNEALVAAREIIHEERSKYQSYNLVILTDGDSCKIQAANNDNTGSGYFFPTYIDGKNNKAYDSSKDKNIRDGNEYGRFNVRGETSFLLGLIKNDLKVKNFVFHFFGRRAEKDYTRHEVKNVDKKVYFLGQNIFKNVEEFFYCDARAMFTLSDYSAEHLDRMSQEEEIDWDDVLDDDVDYDFGIKQGMSQKQIEKEFTKVLSSDKVKRLVASTLVGALCEAY